MQIELKKVWGELTVELGKLDHMKQSKVKILLTFIEDTINSYETEVRTGFLKIKDIDILAYISGHQINIAIYLYIHI